MDAIEILDKVKKIIQQRGQTYDPKKQRERSMGKVVTIFNLLTGLELSEHQGWLFMEILKLVRGNLVTPPHLDSAIDLIAYTALDAECLYSDVDVEDYDLDNLYCDDIDLEDEEETLPNLNVENCRNKNSGSDFKIEFDN